ncbi:MAG: hypothetical protein SCK28_02595, partial [Bacillota bacterium]|nr:hypothetical protein [Bacillota bacterium]
MIAIYILALILAAVGIVAYIQTRSIDVNHIHHTLESNRPVVVCQLSDLHLERNPFSPEKIASIVERQKPDFLTFTGDYIEKEKAI